MRIRIFLPGALAAACLVALIATGLLAADSLKSHDAARQSGIAVAAFGKVLRAWEQQQLERRALGIGLSLADPAIAAAAAAGRATDVAFATAADALAALPEGIAEQASVEAARRRLAVARQSALAELAKPLQQRAALASSALLRDFNQVQATMAAPATAAESAAGRAEPAISQVVLIARIAAALREAAGARSTLLSLHLSGKLLAPEQIVEATEYSGQVTALWERIGVALGALGYPPALTAAVDRTRTTLMDEGERTYRAVLDHARDPSPSVLPSMAFTEFRKFTEPMLGEALALRDAALSEAGRIAREREARASRVLAACLAGTVLATLMVSCSAVLVSRKVVRPLLQLATEVGYLADGHLAAPAGGLTRRDEIGDVARAVETLRLRSLEARRLETELVAQREQESSRLRQMANGTFEGIIIHIDGHILEINDTFCALIGAPAGLFEQRSVARLFKVEGATPPLWEHSAGDDERRRQEVELMREDGSLIPVEMLCRTITYRGVPAQLLAVRDIRERQAAERRIRHLAHHDGLTGLINRTRFNEHLARFLEQARHTGEQFAVLYLDLDRFKAVNDTLGHAAGDELLQQVATRLRETAGAADLVARLGGDEFAVLQAQIGNSQHAHILSTRIVEALSMPVVLDGGTVSIGCSLGIALHPGHGSNGSDLLRRADAALYRAKAQGRGQHCMYEAVMGLTQHTPLVGRFLHDALEPGDLTDR